VHVELNFIGLIEVSSFCWREPSKQNIENMIKRFFPNIKADSIPTTRKRLEKILVIDKRHLVHVFSLKRDKNIAQTIFKAIFIGDLVDVERCYVKHDDLLFISSSQ
jgi:hypothetical protein